MPTALLGTGQMGDGIARTLLSRGHALTVWNRTPARSLPLADAGARVAATIPEAVSGADVVLSIVSDDLAVAAVVEGREGLLASMGRQAIHISMSTISVSLARKLRAAHVSVDQAYLSAPVFGRPAAAASGQLLVVVAGAEDQIARARPVLDAIGRAVVVIGRSPEQANALKLAGNFLIGSIIEALGEAIALARRHDIAPAAFLETLNGGLFKSPVYETYGGLIVNERYSPAGFPVPLGLKDMRLVLQAADAAGVPMPLASLVHDHLLAAIGRGKADLDWSAVAQLIAEDAGFR
jgi:3-hydroxyisobutyrate dehydrogenase-like beta-hydroxyacid dehydrogenase